MALEILQHPSTLPTATTLIGAGGLTVGIYSFIDPVAAARIYGVPVRTTGVTLTSPLASRGSASVQKSSTPVDERPYDIGFTSRDRSYIHALGIRNLTTGLSILSLTAYWHFFLAIASVETRLAVQHVLGIVILVGTLVPVIDAWVCWDTSRAAERSSRGAGKKKDSKDNGGRVSSIDVAIEGGRKAGSLHAARSLIWVAGAVLCFTSPGR